MDAWPEPLHSSLDNDDGGNNRLQIQCPMSLEPNRNKVYIFTKIRLKKGPAPRPVHRPASRIQPTQGGT